MPSAMEECREPSWNFTLSGVVTLAMVEVRFCTVCNGRLEPDMSEDNDKIIVRSVNLTL